MHSSFDCSIETEVHKNISSLWECKPCLSVSPSFFFFPLYIFISFGFGFFTPNSFTFFQSYKFHSARIESFSLYCKTSSSSTLLLFLWDKDSPPSLTTLFFLSSSPIHHPYQSVPLLLLFKCILFSPTLPPPPRLQVRLPSLGGRLALVPWGDMLNHRCDVRTAKTQPP